jgi:flavin-dependent dehydrogenase
MTNQVSSRWESIAERTWDAVVVGAGPAGSIAARELARRGCSVLLVDRAAFPRWKVCGCCLNGSLLATLDAIGLGGLVDRLGAVPLKEVRIAARGCEARIWLSRGAALSRHTFDEALIRAAMDAGASFAAQVEARVEGASDASRVILLRSIGRPARVSARVVLVAHGLSGQALDGVPRLQSRPVRGARIGAGVVVDGAPSDYQPGIIYLASAAGGYVGLVGLEDGRLGVAAALDRELTRASGGPGPAAAAILRANGWPAVPSAGDHAWRGTAALTRRPSKVAAERVFLLGDAAGYVEPFTGEGMAWAAASAVAAAPLAAEAVREWRPTMIGEWTIRHRRLLGGRQSICRTITAGLRHPSVVHTCLAVLSRFPALAGPVMRRLNAPVVLEGIAP